MFLLWMFACSPDSLDFVDPEDHSEFLTDDSWREIPERARLRSTNAASLGWGEGALELDGASSDHPLDREVLVFDVTEEDVGVVVEEASFRLLMTLPRDTLWPVLHESTFTLAGPDERDGVGVQYPSGTRIDPEIRFGDLSMVAAPEQAPWEAGGLKLDTWASAEDIDEVYRTEDDNQRFQFAYDAWLRGDEIMLRDAPDGEVIFAGRPDQLWNVARKIRLDQGAWLVEVPYLETQRIRGYVDADALVSGIEGTQWTVHFRCGTGAYMSHYMRLNAPGNVPAGTWLHLSPDEPPIGVTTYPLDVDLLDIDYGWSLLELETRWGPVEVWAEVR